MSKTILMTGATDGIGLLAAKDLVAEGHTLLLHGRNQEKLQDAAKEIGGVTESYVADLSRLSDVAQLANEIREKHAKLDVLINNAGVLKTAQTRTPDGVDIRFVVNTFAPYLLTRLLLPVIAQDGRIVNLSSAAQAPVNLSALAGPSSLDDMSAYSQSKLAITIWTRELAKELQHGPVVVAVNPGSLLATKMVREGFGVAGKDLQIGADILHRAALGDDFATASGAYFDNDARAFADPHPAALNQEHSDEVMTAVRDAVAEWL